MYNYIPLSSDSVYEMRSSGRYCPFCESTMIFVRGFLYNTIRLTSSVPPIMEQYKCGHCRFVSNEPFVDINFRNNRDKKIEEILNEL